MIDIDTIEPDHTDVTAINVEGDMKGLVQHLTCGTKTAVRCMICIAVLLTLSVWPAQAQILETSGETASQTYGQLAAKRPLASIGAQSDVTDTGPTHILQTGAIAGVVVDAETGDALPGVNVLIVGTTTGTSTNIDGAYEISGLEPGSYDVQASFIGYQTQIVEDIVVRDGQSTRLDFSLQAAEIGMDEVVVVGYGTQRRRDVTGAVSSLQAEEFATEAVESVDALLGGRVAGVQVTQSGEPGAAVSVNIRGLSTVQGGNAPLYIVDGVPVKSGSYSGLDAGGSGANVLADINPNDIESIDVLKDASAAAIYGARASNGVVLITTKSGVAGKPVISFDAYGGIQEMPRLLHVTNAQQSYDIYSYANAATGRPAPVIFSPTAADDRFGYNTDWQKEIYQTAPMANYQLSARGGNEQTNYAVSAGYLTQDGIIINSGFERFTSRLKADFKASDRLNIGTNVLYSQTNRNGTQQGISGIVAVVRNLPNRAVYWPDGTYRNDFSNPVQEQAEIKRDNKAHRTIGTLQGRYVLLDRSDLRVALKSNLGIDYLSQAEDYFQPGTIRNSNRDASFRTLRDLGLINENTVDLHYVRGEHELSAVAGYTQQQTEAAWEYAATTGAPTDAIPTLNAGATIEDARSYKTSWGISSVLGRASYIYKNKYSVAASLRRDGSSRFGANKRYGYFPSVSAYWRLSEEPFFGNVPVFRDVKLRASLGRTGNQEIDNFAAQGLLVPGFNYLGRPGVAPPLDGVRNEDLSWETTTQTNVGIDLLLWDGMTLYADYYVKTTNDLLFAVDVPNVTGYDRRLVNLGSIDNRGFEIALDVNSRLGGLTWDSNLNFSFNRNEVTSLPGGTDIVLGVGILREGEPLGSFYGWNMLGVYARDEDNADGIRMGSSGGPLFGGGDAIFEDLNQDGVINDADRLILGNAQPDFVGGFTNSFRYGGLQLSVMLQFSYGNEIYNDLRQALNDYRGDDPFTEEVLRSWRKPGDVTDIPRPMRNDPMENNRASQRWVEDGSYLRIRNVTLAYSLPGSMLQHLRLNRARVYVSGQNLHTFTSYTGYDPETVTTATGNARQFGIDNGLFPLARAFTVGINIQP